MTKALIVGVSRFGGLEVGHLHGPTHNAVAFAAALLAAPGSLFRDDSIQIELDPTLERFEALFGEFVDDSEYEDDLLVFLSTHAQRASGEDPDLHLYFSDSRETTGAPQHSLRLTHVLERLNAALALRVCFVLEACHSGVLTLELPSRLRLTPLRFLVASCAPTEESPSAKIEPAGVAAFTPFGRYLTDSLLDRSHRTETGYVTARDLVEMINGRAGAGPDLWGAIPEVLYHSTSGPEEHFPLAACNLLRHPPGPDWSTPHVALGGIETLAASEPERVADDHDALLRSAWQRDWRLRFVPRHRPRSVPFTPIVGSMFDARAVVEHRAHVVEQSRVMTWRGFDALRTCDGRLAPFDVLPILGPTASGWIDPAEWRTVGCPMCDVTGRVKGCPAGCLDGIVTVDGSAKCDRCDGVGRRNVTKEQPCFPCDGRGYLESPLTPASLPGPTVPLIEPTVLMKPTASDAGFVDITSLLRQPPTGPPVNFGHVRTQCRPCRGTGRVAVSTPELCPKCNGATTVATREEQRCQTCHGTGTRTCDRCGGRRSVPRAKVHRTAVDRVDMALALRRPLTLGRVSAEPVGDSVVLRDGSASATVAPRPSSTRTLGGPAAVAFLCSQGVTVPTIDTADESLQARERATEVEANVLDITAVTYAAAGGHFERAVVFSGADVVFPAALAEARRVIRDVAIGCGGLLVALAVLVTR